MTDVDRVQFAQAFNRLAVAARLPADEGDAAMKQIYFEGLEDLSVDAVELAAERLAKSSQWFPKVAEWRQAAQLAHVAALNALPPGRENPWTDECDVCRDTGWEERRCYPQTGNTCGRPRCDGDVPEHTYVTKCACRPTNRTYARHHLPKGQEAYPR